MSLIATLIAVCTAFHRAIRRIHIEGGGAGRPLFGTNTYGREKALTINYSILPKTRPAYITMKESW